MIRPSQIKRRIAMSSACPVKCKSKRQQTDMNSIISPFFRPKKLGRFIKSDTDVLDLALLTPTRESDLAVHRMKLEELKNWLRTTMGVNRGPKTLLLTGPSGSGKASALRVLCAEFGIEVNEFDCTEEFVGETSTVLSVTSSSSKRSGESQLDGFKRFLRSNEFSSIQNMSLKHRLLLIGQLPNAFYLDPSKLHSVLANVLPSSRCLVAFVLANVDSFWELSPFRLFPTLLLEQLKILHIKFNPINDSLLRAAIKRIFGLIDQRCDAELIKHVVSCANGDIRRALNTLLFSLIKIGRPPLQLSGQKPLEFFHFIAKVLYAKRKEVKSGVTKVEMEQWQKSEQKLGRKLCERHGRPFPTKDEPNQLIASSPISGQLLLGYVFEHEQHFAPSLSASAKVNATIAELDVMKCQFGVDNERLTDKYTLEVAVRCSLFHNFRPTIEKSSSHQTFYHFDKPRFYENDVQRREQRLRMSQVIGVERTAQMATLIVPLLMRIRARGAASAEQRQMLDRMGPNFNASQAEKENGWQCRPRNASASEADEGQNYEIDDSESGDEGKSAEEDHQRQLLKLSLLGLHR